MGEGVTYEFKELFDRFAKDLSDGFNRLDHRLDELNRRLDNKADNTRVAELEGRIAHFEIAVNDRFKPLEEDAVGNRAVSKLHRRIANGCVAIAASSVGALLYLVVTGGIH